MKNESNHTETTRIIVVRLSPAYVHFEDYPFIPLSNNRIQKSFVDDWFDYKLEKREIEVLKMAELPRSLRKRSLLSCPCPSIYSCRWATGETG